MNPGRDERLERFAAMEREIELGTRALARLTDQAAAVRRERDALLAEARTHEARVRALTEQVRDARDMAVALQLSLEEVRAADRARAAELEAARRENARLRARLAALEGEG